MECKEEFENIVTIPEFQTGSEAKLLFRGEWKEWGLLQKTGLPPHRLKGYCCDALFDMMDYDKINNTDHLVTSRTHVECDLNVLRTTETLFIHYNSVQYRLRRIRELFGLDVFSSTAIFQIMLSSHILEYIE